MTSRLLATFLLLFGLGGMALSAAPSASAHDQLTGSTPADGATVGPQTDITLTFSASVVSTGTRVQVAGPDGATVSSGAATVAEQRVTQAVSASAPGRYAVTWRVTSSDGHPISGRFSFTVRGGSAPATSTATTAPSSTGVGGGAGSASPGTGSTSTSSTTSILPSQRIGTNATRNEPWLILGLTAVALVAIGAGVVISRRRLRDDN